MSGGTRASQHAADSPFWSLYIAVKTRDQMHMDMHSRLPTGVSDIDADIETVRGMLFYHVGMGFIEQCLNRSLFRRCHVEIVSDVTARYDEDVALAQAVIVEAHIGVLVLEQDHVGFAQLAIIIACHSDAPLRDTALTGIVPNDRFDLKEVLQTVAAPFPAIA